MPKMTKKELNKVITTSNLKRDDDLLNWRPNKIGAVLFIIILVMFTATLQAQDRAFKDSTDAYNKQINELMPAHLLRLDAVRNNDLRFFNTTINNGSDPAYCWTEFMGDDGLGFGARIWNFHVSVMSDCDILKQECLHFQNVSETFDCSWNDNTCTCRLREIENCVNTYLDAEYTINAYDRE